MTRYWLPRSRRPILLRAKPPNVAHQFMDRNASVVSEGPLREGAGTITTESGVLSNAQYSFGGRFSEGIGTNPNELIAALLGGCFSMAFSNELGISGFHPERIETIETATLEELGAGWTLTYIQLDVRANVPDASQTRFIEAALAAKTNVQSRVCSIPISP